MTRPSYWHRARLRSQEIRLRYFWSFPAFVQKLQVGGGPFKLQPYQKEFLERCARGERLIIRKNRGFPGLVSTSAILAELKRVADQYRDKTEE